MTKQEAIESIREFIEDASDAVVMFEEHHNYKLAEDLAGKTREAWKQIERIEEMTEEEFKQYQKGSVEV